MNKEMYLISLGNGKGEKTEVMSLGFWQQKFRKQGKNLR